MKRDPLAQLEEQDKELVWTMRWAGPWCGRGHGVGGAVVWV